MDRRRWIDREQRTGLGESREQVLDLLRAAEQPVGVREVAERTGLHLNTARFHLDGLVDAGLAVRETEAGGRRGRPRVIYRPSTTASTPAGTGARSYRLLAEILTGVATRAHAEPSAIAREAGQDWGHYLADRPSPLRRTTAGEAVDKLTAILADIGFEPEPVPDDHQPQILLRHCPFREVAEHSQQVVCAIHLGLMQGALAEMRAPVTAERLEPFVQPSLCRAHLSRQDGTRPAAG
ncbi:helix-turn-helix transcriptional regulator [Micromonospora coxensis]|uniref:helix-turn-helix transcriptional regulator n=1 Tax=Micromonospora coxensis TaxID=356852 RepID=UPI00343FAE4E